MGVPLIIGVFFLAGCDAWTDEEAADPPLLRPSNTLSERLRASLDTGRVVGSQAKATGGEATPVALRPVADIDPPTVNEGEGAAQPGASHLYVDENRVYVSYTTPGVAFGGAIDILDATNPDDPSRANAYTSSVMDVSAVAPRSGQGFFAAGGARPDAVTTEDGEPLDSPAIVVGLDRATAEVNDLRDLASGAATDITTRGNLVFTVTGEEGFLYQFGRSLTERGRIPASDLRSVVAGPLLYVLQGNGAVQWANTDDRGTIAALSPLRDLGGGIGDRTIARMHYQAGLHNGLLYVALNDGGFAVLDANTGVPFEEVTDGRYTAVASPTPGLSCSSGCRTPRCPPRWRTRPNKAPIRARTPCSASGRTRSMDFRPTTSLWARTTCTWPAVGTARVSSGTGRRCRSTPHRRPTRKRSCILFWSA